MWAVGVGFHRRWKWGRSREPSVSCITRCIRSSLEGVLRCCLAVPIPLQVGNAARSVVHKTGADLTRVIALELVGAGMSCGWPGAAAGALTPSQ